MGITKPLVISCMCVTSEFFIPRIQVKWLREQVMGKGCHFGQFLSNTCLTQMVNSVRIKVGV